LFLRVGSAQSRVELSGGNCGCGSSIRVQAPPRKSADPVEPRPAPASVQAMYVNWRNLLASGKLPGMTRQSTTKPLPELVSVNYEAHFRCELAAVLQHQGHRHCSLDSAKRDRANNFVQVRRCVRKDRRDNLQAAEGLRIGIVERSGTSGPRQPTHEWRHS
jgi:hypothetical protein